MDTAAPATNTKLDELVRYLQLFGFPKPVSAEDLGETLTESQMRVIAEALDLVDAHTPLKEEYLRTQKELEKQPRSGISWLPYELEAEESKKRFTDFWQKTRVKLQEAILVEELLDLKWVRETAILFGAIPNPKDGFVYYLDLDGNDRCWKDDGLVIETWEHYRGYGGENSPDAIYYTCCGKCGQRPGGQFPQPESLLKRIDKNTPRVSHSDESRTLSACLSFAFAWFPTISHCESRFRSISIGEEMDLVNREFLRRGLIILEEVFSEIQKPVKKDLREWDLPLPKRVFDSGLAGRFDEGS